MTEEQKKEVAVFRYGVIADFVGATRLDRGEREVLLRRKCARKWRIPFSSRTRLSRSTILRWAHCYTEAGGWIEPIRGGSGLWMRRPVWRCLRCGGNYPECRCPN